MHSKCDGIILGTGHNALVLQAYLAHSGLRVLSLERSSAPGGGLVTEESPRFPGFWRNAHPFFHRALTALPWNRDLEPAPHCDNLSRRNSRTIQPVPACSSSADCGKLICGSRVLAVVFPRCWLGRTWPHGAVAAPRSWRGRSRRISSDPAANCDPAKPSQGEQRLEL